MPSLDSDPSPSSSPPATAAGLGYLGPAGSHSHQAALAVVTAGLVTPAPENLELLSCPSLHRLLEAVAAGELPLALLPVENALEGSVVEVMEALGLARLPLAVRGEVRVPVRHCLVAPAAGLPKAVTAVLSHPQALGQCRETLRRLFGPDVRLVPTASTSEAVHWLAEGTHPYGSGAVALGTAAAAAMAGLPVVDPDLSDAPDNCTRFFLATPSATPLAETLPPGSEPMGYKTSLCLGLVDRPGALVDVLSLFRDAGLNLSRIESRPSRKRFGEYVFYLDVETRLDAPAHAPLREALAKATTWLNVIGPYPVWGLLGPELPLNGL